MFKTATLPMHRNPLNVPVNCDNCGTPMTTDGADYACPTNAGHGPASCPITPVNAEILSLQAAAQILRRLTSDSTVAVLTGDVLRTSLEASRLQEERLQRSESSIEELNLLKQQLLEQVEKKLATYEEVAEEINRINAARTGLTYESQIAQEELDKLAFIADPEGLKEDAQNLAAHLPDADPEEIRMFLSIFVQEIRVGPESAEIHYTHPLPDEQNHPKIAFDRIALAA